MELKNGRLLIEQDEYRAGYLAHPDDLPDWQEACHTTPDKIRVPLPNGLAQAIYSISVEFLPSFLSSMQQVTELEQLPPRLRRSAENDARVLKHYKAIADNALCQAQEAA